MRQLRSVLRLYFESTLPRADRHDLQGKQKHRPAISGAAEIGETELAVAAELDDVALERRCSPPPSRRPMSVACRTARRFTGN